MASSGPAAGVSDGSVTSASGSVSTALTAIVLVTSPIG
jgi:hypothetical protein